MSRLIRFPVVIASLIGAPCCADSVASDQPVVQVSLVTKIYNSANISYVAVCVSTLQRTQDYFYYYFDPAISGSYEEKRANQIFAMLLAAKTPALPIGARYPASAMAVPEQ